MNRTSSNRNELESRNIIHLLASPQGGVAASSNKFRVATAANAAGVVFRPPLRLWIHRKTTPASRFTEASRHFIDRSATPPCGDARRGIMLLDLPPIFVNNFSSDNCCHGFAFHRPAMKRRIPAARTRTVYIERPIPVQIQNGQIRNTAFKQAPWNNLNDLLGIY